MEEITALDFLLNELDILKIIEKDKLTMVQHIVDQARLKQRKQIEESYIAGRVALTNGNTVDMAVNYYERTYNQKK